MMVAEIADLSVHQLFGQVVFLAAGGQRLETFVELAGSEVVLSQLP